MESELQLKKREEAAHADQVGKALRAEREREAKRAEREREGEAERRKETELEKLQIQTLKVDPESCSIGETESRSILPKLSNFMEGKDDLDSWLTRFERFVEMN
ncbi:hypothetical protein PoB_001161200 [Plakobranchus ocellatus]|uniref:Troponin T n=1 Tax=Plakobranchus ocellatus TaxID=259542 RepID=A0AAV3YRJ0_9GAST|nr:hypothetical protein PoB_001161200 [Plakobranchus ocellatus]